MAETINQQDAIEVIDDPVDAVRTLPDVYIGALGNSGFLNMYREILQNSLDEIIKGNTLDKNIIVSFDERTHMCIIEDNGQGIDLNMLDVVFIKLHSSSNYNKVEGSGRYSAGKNGMGGTITNFLSEFFIAESYRMDGTAARVTFKEGRISKKGVEKIKCPAGKHGLIVTFGPSKMMGEITTTIAEIQQLTWIVCNLCVIGTRITLNSINTMNQKNTVVIENKRGITELLDNICTKAVMAPAYFEEDNGSMKVQVLFTYDASMEETLITSTANMCPTSNGTHVTGFLDAMVRYFRNYMNKIYLANNKKLQVDAQDVRTGLRAVISVYALKPLFTGQSKEIYSQEAMKPFVKEVTEKALAQWAQTSPLDLQKVSKYLKDVCEVRSKMDNAKVEISKKYNTSAITDLPAKYIRPNTRNKPFELWIVEGDSCASALENNRDKACQGVFPIKGKMLNPYVTPTKRYFENDEVAGIFHICGYKNYAKKFDPEQFKPSKVVIATDADADGSHIQCLVFGLFLRYLPFVIEQGKLFVANPPLYGAMIGKSMKFFAGNKDYIEYVQNLFCKNNVVTNIKGKELTKKELTSILIRNMDYVKLIQHVSNTFAIDPYFLEFLLMNRKLDYKKFKTAVEKAYRFTKVEQENGITVIRGLVGSKYQTVFFDNRILDMCGEICNLIDRSEDYYRLNGEQISLYGLMITFNKFEPSNLTRYKGQQLGPVLWQHSA